MKKYGFEIEAENEQSALHKLVDERWSAINEYEVIVLLGEVIKEIKVKDQKENE